MISGLTDREKIQALIHSAKLDQQKIEALRKERDELVTTLVEAKTAIEESSQLMKEQKARIKELEQALENLCGDVYLYDIREIVWGQVIDTQHKGLKLLEKRDE